MKFGILNIFIFTCFCIQSQTNLSGVWQGVIQQYGTSDNEATIFFVNFEIDDKVIVGKTREEVYNTDLYAIQKIKGTSKGNSIEFNQFLIESKKKSSKITWCSADFIGEYVDSTAYLKGTFKSSTCRRYQGTFILYRSKIEFPSSELPSLGHSWRNEFLKDLKSGRKAPEIRDRERANFKFKSIYFDHDKTEIKEEFRTYLLEMIRVVNGHSDLRIEITGHTDADGSEVYNQDLSRRRVKALEDFFKANGLELKKLQIDFKGELQPIDDNTTEEGKQKNRRVDFRFI